MAKTNEWNISLARYNKKTDWVMERNVFSCESFEEAFPIFEKLARADRAVYMWAKDAVCLENPYFAISESFGYKKEWDKIKNKD